VKKWRHMCGVYAYRHFTREQFVSDQYFLKGLDHEIEFKLYDKDVLFGV
jgi:hypothetical protein